MANRILVERNLVIPMRDGVITRADLYRPDETSPCRSCCSAPPMVRDLLILPSP